MSRGRASEQLVCVYEAVSVEKGARRPLLPAAVACPPGCRRRRLAITAEGSMMITAINQPLHCQPKMQFKSVRLLKQILQFNDITITDQMVKVGKFLCAASQHARSRPCSSLALFDG